MCEMMDSCAVVQTKKFVNDPDHSVDDMLVGLSRIFPGLTIDRKSNVVMHFQDESKEHVGIVSGGGSGHEPFAAGFVGKGMLTAAVPGCVFASPPMTHCLAGIHNVALQKTGGVLVLVLNYTGDVLNFGLACEAARDTGHQVESVVVGDDCALLVPGRKKTLVGRRGLVGMLFVIKIAGSMAVKGDKLCNIKEASKSVANSMATVGVCTQPCSLPGATGPLFTLAPQLIQLGVGIHGEPGIEVMKLCSAKEITKIILKKIVVGLKLGPGDSVCAMINNLGSSTLLECCIVAGELTELLEKSHISLLRMYVGALVTSLDMGGLQICILRVTDHMEWLHHLDAPTEATAWPGCLHSFEKSKGEFVAMEKKSVALTGPELNEDQCAIFKLCLEKAAESLILNEKRLNELDSGCGDGDCGSTLRRFADGILENLSTLPVSRPRSCLLRLSEIASDSMGGTSGGVYSLLLRGASRDVPDWPKALRTSIDTVSRYSAARRGDRTLMDALIPACEEFEKYEYTTEWTHVLESAVAKAVEGCEETRTMEAIVGRSAYVADHYLTDVDAGAFGVTVWLQAICKVLKK